jgi:hypothetical protein
LGRNPVHKTVIFLSAARGSPAQVALGSGSSRRAAANSSILPRSSALAILAKDLQFGLFLTAEASAALILHAHNRTLLCTAERLEV